MKPYEKRKMRLLVHSAAPANDFSAEQLDSVLKGVVHSGSQPDEYVITAGAILFVAPSEASEGTFELFKVSKSVKARNILNSKTKGRDCLVLGSYLKQKGQMADGTVHFKCSTHVEQIRFGSIFKDNKKLLKTKKFNIIYADDADNGNETVIIGIHQTVLQRKEKKVFSEEDFFVLEEVLDHSVARNECFVSWRGYADNTWEPVGEIVHSEAWDAYMDSLEEEKQVEVQSWILQFEEDQDSEFQNHLQTEIRHQQTEEKKAERTRKRKRAVQKKAPRKKNINGTGDNMSQTSIDAWMASSQDM